jgi:hypothetical protein
VSDGVGPVLRVFQLAIDARRALGDVREIRDQNGHVIVKKILRAGERGNYRVEPPASFERAWHGTRANHVCSILAHGLRASGTALPDGTRIAPPSSHFALGRTHEGVENWAGAIFVSPSVSYASHACYAERVRSGSAMWAVIIECAVRPGSFLRHAQTLGRGYSTLPGEPESSEYRVEVRDECDEQIWRADQHQDVVVLVCALVNVNFLETSRLTYKDLRELVSGLQFGASN